MARGEKVTRQLSIFINGKEVKNSLGAIGREIGKVKGQLREANDPKDIRKYKAELDQLRGKYGEVKEEIDGTNDSLEDARGHFDNLLQGILSGDITQVSAGLKGIVGNIKGMTKAALAFIATPLGAAIAAVTAIGFGIKKWVDYNLEIEKTNQLIRDLTQESGRSVDLIRVRAEELSKTFDVEVKESVESAKSLAQSFGISYNDAFDIIEDGAIRGKLRNDEFLDSLKEYPVQFKNAGFSAQDFANIVSTGIDLSIYSDKLPDAIKEFNLAISEQTDASKEALKNAFGEEFTNNLLQNLKDGSITAKDALAEISAEAERIGLNSQQAQLLTADLFKGAGEDAGGALKIFEAVNLALNEQKKPLTDIQQLQKEQLEANKELNSVYTQLFASGSKGFGMLIDRGKLFATKTILNILKGGINLYNWFIDLNNESRVFSGIMSVIGKVATLQFSIISEGAKLIWGQVKSLGTLLEGVFTLDVAKIKEGLSQSVSEYSKSFTRLKEKATQDAQDIFNAFSGKNQKEKFSLDDFLTEDVNAVGVTKDTVPSAPGKVANKNGDGELTEEDKAILESKKRLHQLLKENELERENQKREEEILKAETEEEKVMLELERLQWIANQELEIEKNKELAKLAEKKATEAEIAATEEKYRLQREKMNKSFDAERAKAIQKLKEDQEKAAEETAENDELLARQRNATYAQMFGNISELLGKNTSDGKAAALAQALMNTYQGVSEVWKTPSTLPEPAATVARGVSTATVLASGLGAVRQIRSTDTSFFAGGPTGNKALYKDEYGDVVGAVHANEWVAPEIMTQDPRYAPTLQWLEAERKKKLGKFFDGGPTSENGSAAPSESSSPAPAASGDNADLAALLTRLNNNLEKGIKSYTVRNYEEYLNQKEMDEQYEQIQKNTQLS